MNLRRIFLCTIGVLTPMLGSAQGLPFGTVFRGQAKFESLMAGATAQAAQVRAMPIGERTAWFGQQLVGTPYKGFTLEIDDSIEAPSANFNGLDCWTFFEISLAMARLTEQPPNQWSAPNLLRYIEVDRYWHGRCDGTYLSRLHYLEDWATDNDKRGLMDDLTRKLGGIRVSNAATEMTINAASYRYMRSSATNRSGIAKLEAGLRGRPLIMIPVAKVAAIEPQIHTGDVIGIVSKVREGTYGTSHVGLAIRRDGVLRFMHASSAKGKRAVVIDSQLSVYLASLSKHAGILVVRPVR
jgi:hypothetical protein